MSKYHHVECTAVQHQNNHHKPHVAITIFINNSLDVVVSYLHTSI
jgi:hypothetical protein